MEPFQATDHEECLYITSWTNRWPVAAGISTRRGGVSPPPYESLNAAFHVGDEAGGVVENRKRVSRAAGFSFESWTCAEQVHESRLVEVKPEHRGAGRRSQEDAIRGTDGLYTREKGILLASFYADCVPLFFFDPSVPLIGVAHAGWRGTVAEIGPKMVRQWKDHYGVSPDRIRAAIGPSIGGCCYEVDEKVAAPVRERVPDWESALERKANGKYMLDLRIANANLLKKAGIRRNHIEVTDLCTSCRNDLFFSHRREEGKTGRMAAFVGLKDEVV